MDVATGNGAVIAQTAPLIVVDDHLDILMRFSHRIVGHPIGGPIVMMGMISL